jgi:hypothetical protein
MIRFFPLSLALACLAAAPTTKPISPTTKPTTRPAIKPTPQAAMPSRIRDGLINGSVRFLVPQEWELADRSENGNSVTYKLPDDKGHVAILVSQQAESIPNSDMRVRQKLAQFVLEQDNLDLKNRKMEIIDAPKVEPDARFMVKVHERFKDEDAIIDAIHIYRGVGINLVSITASANTDDKNDAKAVHDAGALMLQSVTIGPPDKKIMREIPK